jgi:hypothetical protein
MQIVLILILILLYFLAIIRLDLFYNNRYFWNQNCRWERVGTSLIQPIMELFGNSMTAHFWHFQDFTIDRNCFEHDKFILQLNSNRKSFRKFNNIPILSFFSSAYVDINPFQTCAIIRPKDYIGKWKIVFARDWNHNLFSIEKCSHVGAVKVVVDGSGGIMGQGESGSLIELELVKYCKAWQNTYILFV